MLGQNYQMIAWGEKASKNHSVRFAKEGYGLSRKKHLKVKPTNISNDNAFAVDGSELWLTTWGF